ncbi:MAG: hypothetical protein U0667_17125 [Chloroflexota bacterium]
MSRNHRVSLVALAVAALTLASCYNFATPSYHPGEGRDLVAAIARHGVTVGSVIPGASACDDPSLIPNALHLAVTDPADGAARDVWVYSFREKYWDASKTQVDACATELQADQPGATVSRLDIPLYRALGIDWSDDLAQSLQAGLAEAAQAGEP